MNNIFEIFSTKEQLESAIDVLYSCIWYEQPDYATKEEQEEHNHVIYSIIDALEENKND